MLLSVAVKLDVLSRQMLEVKKSILEGLRGSIMEAHRQEAARDLDEEGGSGFDNRTPLPAMMAAYDFELLEIVQATIYAMLLNNAVGLGIVSGFIVVDLKASLEGLQWSSFESWMHRAEHGLLEAQLHQQSDRREKERDRRKIILFQNFTSTEIAAEYIRDSFRWPLREASALRLNPLSTDYHGHCSGFDLGVAI
ncbi:hypothetical protein Cgig2_006777 [Carnegiea gigantea]|uniref:Uncharacterized protein n=1 Tax=Carnegiea gigantea TaxID=171969 RepID=A0A9Q1JRW2_9CARY|nr:hypothetical protein Cgig2_006777 [Carnegiea gigantea]